MSAKARRIAEGLCRDCTQPAVPGRKRCADCLARTVRNEKARRAANIAAGRCERCSIGSAPLAPGEKLCERHKRQVAERAARRRTT